MGLTLNELKLLERSLLFNQWEEQEALVLIRREIRLKELEKQIPKMDISGRDMD